MECRVLSLKVAVAPTILDVQYTTETKHSEHEKPYFKIHDNSVNLQISQAFLE